MKTTLRLLPLLLIFSVPLFARQVPARKKAAPIFPATYMTATDGRQAINLNEELMTLVRKGVTLRDIVKVFNKRKGVCFVANDAVLAFPKKINTNYKDLPLPKVLQKLKEVFPIVFELKGQTIIISFDPNFFPVVLCQVVDPSNQPVVGALITAPHSDEPYITGKAGSVFIPYLFKGDTLAVGSDQYVTLRVKLDAPYVRVTLRAQAITLNKVTVTINNGYQKYTNEVRTGSAKVVDMDLYANGSANTNFVDQIENIMPVANHKSRLNGSVPGPARGSNSFYGNKNGFVVVNDFPWPLPTDLINPINFDSITLLRDAGSAAIWGISAANGVWNLSLKKGHPGKMRINFQSSLSVGEKPNNLYQQGMSPAARITFDSLTYKEPGAYNPVRDQLTQVDNNLTTIAEARQLFNRLRGNDLLSDIRKRLYNPPITQQYAITLEAGNSNLLFFASAGLDQKKLAENDGEWTRRTALINTSYRQQSFLLEGTLALTGINSNDRSLTIPVSPRYLSLTQPDGTPASLPYLYTPDFIAQARQNNFLDWSYVPLNEAALVNNKTNQRLYSFTGKASYWFWGGFKASVAYQHNLYLKNDEQLHQLASFFTRDLINQYRQKDSSGKISWPIPQGDILDGNDMITRMNNVRAQLDYTVSKNNWKFTAYTGIDRRSFDMTGKEYRVYGRNLSASSYRINYDTEFPLSTSGKAKVPLIDHLYDSTDHFFSAYSSGTITYNSRYIFSANFRKDWSNHFSRSLNKKGIGLWSVGAGWNIHKEDFFKDPNIRMLKLRATYGISGNVDFNAIPTHSIQADNNGQTYAYAVASTGQIGWEKIAILNAGADVENKWAVISVDYYIKRGKDLLQYSIRNPVTGTNIVKDNSGSLSGQGYDIDIKTKMIELPKKISYSVGLVIAHTTNKTTSFGGVQKMASEIINPYTYAPVAGHSTDALFAYKFARLNGQNGAPMGYVDGKETANHAAIMATTNGSSIQDMGSAVPTTGINWLNSFHFQNWSISAMINMKLGYKVRKPALNYYKMVMGLGGEAPGFERKWEKPGQELTTNIPALDLDNNAMAFYESSDVNVVKGDHARLHYVQIAYRWHKPKGIDYTFLSFECFLTANNLGIIFRKNKDHLDPDVPLNGIPAGRSLTLTIKLSY